MELRFIHKNTKEKIYLVPNTPIMGTISHLKRGI